MGNNIKISLVIPVYNTERYLDELIQSLLKQTMTELEFIFVNDGSTDDSLNVIEKYAEKDERFIVIDKKNEGVSVARNIGIQRARGNYIGFIDADDFVANNMYEILYCTAQKKEADIVSCGYVSYQPEKSTLALNEYAMELNREQAIRCLLRNRVLGMGICNKLFKRECLNGVFFDKKYRINEDRLFSFHAICKAKKIVVIPDALYFYRMNSESVSHARFNLSKMDGLYVAKELERATAKLYPQLQKESYACVVMSTYYTLLSMYKCDAIKEFPEEHQRLMDEIRKTKLIQIRQQVNGRKLALLFAIKYCEPIYRYAKRWQLKRG